MKPKISITPDYKKESQKYIMSEYYVNAVKKA